MPAEEKSPLLLAQMAKQVKAEVIDLDHYRIRGGMAVETDYIIKVEPVGRVSPNTNPQFEGFTLSKTYSAFRTLGQQLKKAADSATNTNDPLPKSVQKLAQYCETVMHLVEAERTQYLGKVNYIYVQVLAKKRSHIINQTLEATLSYFPDEIDSHPFLKEVAQTVETFFLLDHCLEEELQSSGQSGHRRITSIGNTFKSTGHNRATSIGNPFKTPKKYNSLPPRAATNEAETEAKKPSLNLVEEPLKKVVVEPLEKVGNAVGNAVGQVGSFLMDKLGDGGTKGISQTIEKPIDTETYTPNPIDTTLRSPVVPYTRKNRRSHTLRDKDDEELREMGVEASFLLDDDRPQTELVPSYSHPLPTFGSPGSKLGDLLETNPIIFSAIFFGAAAFLKWAAKLSVTMDLDILCLLIWAAFCIGLHTPRPMVGGIDKSAAPPRSLPTPGGNRIVRKNDRHGRQLLRMSMASTPDGLAAAAAATNFIIDETGRNTVTCEEILEEEGFDDIMVVGQSPLPRFPHGAKLGSKLNCWSEPEAESFQVRGSNYLKDKIKEASGPFVFPVRATDLFLTDNCPENAGSNAGILGGALREKPTFIINFRLPWGLFLAYFEIPERFLLFVRAGHEEGFDKSKLPSMDSMTPSDRCVARFCQDPQSEKNKKLKIVPVVVEGPWVVKSVVGGKPAIIGNKLPVNYHYAPPEGNKALYLEADLDIVASSAARGILSVARTYTRVLTIDLGFVVQGNKIDELAEQMLVGARLHGIDPMTAPPYPPCKDMMMHTIPDADESSDEI